MKQNKLIELFPRENKITGTRSYINHSVEFKKEYSARERMKKLSEVGWNVFFCPSEYVTGCDLLSDSGTTAMTNIQWGAMHEGDEAYGSNRGYFLLAKTIRDIWGKEFFNPNAKTQNAFLFHQGRAGEDALFTQVGTIGKNLIIPSNGHFDTTGANIEANSIEAKNLFSTELQGKKHAPFMGNMDIKRLSELLKKSARNIPIIFLTITNNTGGGQPVSMENIRAVSRLARGYNIPLFFDAGRFAENAWFIKHREKKYKQKTIQVIVKEMFSYVDGCTMSFKKDGLSNMGGGVFFKENGLFVKKYPRLLEKMIDKQILTEGHPTYGGMTGRDIMTIAVGLRRAITSQYMDHRIGQVARFGQLMKNSLLPVIAPFGGHAIYLDMNQFFSDTKHKPEDFGGIAFAALLLGIYGHRVSELGNFAFGKYNPRDKKHSFPENNFLRFAVPRLRYEDSDLIAVVEAVKALYENRRNIPKIKVVYGLDKPLRHFKGRFELV